MIRGVIFDLGSTLIRFRGTWADVLAEGRAAMVDYLTATGYALDRVPFADVLKAIFETNFRERRLDHRERTTRSLVQEALARLNVPTIAEEHLDEALKRLYAPSEARWSGVPGAGSVLDVLQARGRRLGMISNASDVDNVQRLIDAAGIRRYFDPIVISAAAGVRKPTPGLFEAVLRGWRIAANEAVMVGDMLGEDILGAQRAGLHQIWIRGEADAALNQEHVGVVVPEATVDQLAEVPSAVERLDGGG
jgi:HAD superfamily hydrolase (TIGR01662 family)